MEARLRRIYGADTPSALDYAALLPALLSYIADGNLMAKSESYNEASSSHLVPSRSAGSTDSAALLVTASGIWGSDSDWRLGKAVNPELSGLLYGTIKSLSEQAILDHRTAAIYTQDLLTCIRELPTPPDGPCQVEASLANMLWFLCKACATRRNGLSLSKKLQEQVAAERFGLHLESASDAVDTNSLQVQGEGQSEAAERLQQEHLGDVEVMSRLLEEIKRASSLPVARIQKEETDYFGPLTTFVSAPTALARRNADWLFKNGAEPISKLFVASDSVYVSPQLIELLLRKAAGIPQDRRISKFARLGVVSRVVEGCEAITPAYGNFGEAWVINSMRIMSHSLKNSAVRKGFPAARVLDHLWRTWLPEPEEVDDTLYYSEIEEMSSTAPPMSQTSLQVLEFMVELAPCVFTSTPTEAWPYLTVDSGCVSRLMGACNPNGNLQKAGVNIGRLLFRLMDPPEGAFSGVAWTSSSFGDCFQVLVNLREKEEVWEKPDKITAYMLQMFKAFRTTEVQLLLYFSNLGTLYWKVWANAAEKEETLPTRKRALDILSEIIKAALDVKHFPSSYMGLTRDALIYQTRGRLGCVARETAAELLDGKEGKMPLSEQTDTLATLSQLCVIINQVYGPEYSVPSPTDEEQDRLLDFCCRYLALGLTDEHRRARNLRLQLNANFIHLSRAVAILIRAPELGAGWSLAEARDSPSVAAAGDLCERYHRPANDDDEDNVASRGFAHAAEVGKLLSTVKCGEGTAMGLAMTAFARLACIAALARRNHLKKRGLTTCEDTGVEWITPWVGALALTGRLDPEMKSSKERCEARIDAACLTDVLAPALAHSRDVSTLGMVMTCFQEAVTQWAGTRHIPQSLSVLLKSLVEAHVVLAKVVPEPRLWASGCRQMWKGVLRLQNKIKLPGAVLGRVDVLLRQLDALEEAFRNAAMKALLDEEEAESRQQEAKKAKKKSKQAARKQKAQAAKTAKAARNSPEETVSTLPPSAAQVSATGPEADLNRSSTTVNASSDGNIETTTNTGDLDEALGLQPSASPSKGSKPPILSADAQERAAATETDNCRSTLGARAEGSSSPPSIPSSLPEIAPASRHGEPAAANGASRTAASTRDGHVRLGVSASTASGKKATVLTAARCRPRPALATAERLPPQRPGGEGLADCSKVSLAISDTQPEADKSSHESPEAAHMEEEAGLMQHMEEICTCPITQELFQDPVAAADGFTYERSKIEEWLQKSATSPMTGAPLPSLKLQPNLLVRQMLSTLLGQQGSGR